ncbi:hypothetical protein O6H91_23G067100 [Diphasiastrum complanatum]|uniref:Uncharacterized protein n=1 Tax=Diphasiastrum complanatum TaxID=34168 RepID=A0ACC2ABP2_DIPCM|nr:hypothetical protein O6H91_23G067100 [Diphasiastrum complanatum]
MNGRKSSTNKVPATGTSESGNGSISKQNSTSVRRVEDRILESSDGSSSILNETMSNLGSKRKMLIRQAFPSKPSPKKSSKSRHVRSSSQTSIDDGSLMSHPRSVSFNEASVCPNKILIRIDKPETKLQRILSSDTVVQHRSPKNSCTQAQNAADKSHFKYLSARAVAEKLAKAFRGSLKTCPKDVKSALSDRTSAYSSTTEETATSTQEFASPSTSSKGRLNSEKSIGSTNLLNEQVCNTEGNNRGDQTFERRCSSSAQVSITANGDLTSTPTSSGKASSDESDANNNAAYAHNCAFTAQASEEPNPFHFRRQHTERHEDEVIGKKFLPMKSKWEEKWPQPENHELISSAEVQLWRQDPVITSFILSIDGHLRRITCSNENLEEKIQAAEERLATVEKEIAFPFDGQSPNVCKGCRENTASSIRFMKQIIEQLQEETKLLALEVVSEVKVRIFEREKVWEIVELMKKETELFLNNLERHKMQNQTNLENELQRREAEWCSKLKRMQAEERRLRERVRELAEEKIGLQKELAAVASKGTALTAKARTFEIQTDLHKKRLEDTETTILELRQSLMTSHRRTREAERELDEVKKNYTEKDVENIDLRRLIGRLQQLCTDHEKSIQGLWQAIKRGVGAGTRSEDEGQALGLQHELVRLSGVEQKLRNDLELSRREVTTIRRELRHLVDQLKTEKTDVAPSMNSKDKEYQEHLHTLQTRIKELQNENHISIVKLKAALKEKQDLLTSSEVLNSVRACLEGDVKALQQELMQEKDKLRGKKMNFEWLERREDAISKDVSVVAFEGRPVSQDSYSFGKEEISDEKPDVKVKVCQTLEVTTQQLVLTNEKVDVLTDKLSERESQLLDAKAECDKKEEVIKTLQQNLYDMKKALDTQSRRILQLHGRNEELFVSYNSKQTEFLELQTNLRKEAERTRNLNLEVQQVKQQLRELQGETKAQELHCEFLREKLCSREVELDHSLVAATSSTQHHDILQREILLLQTSLHESNQRVLNLEDQGEYKSEQLSRKEEKAEFLQAEYDRIQQELLRLRKDLFKVSRQRDDVQREAEDLGREALRMSAEVEVLRRKVNQLEEDIMLKDGQLAILQGSLEECE